MKKYLTYYFSKALGILIFSEICGIIAITDRGGERVEIMKEDVFRKELKNGLGGGFLFFGDEDYMKSFLLRAAREAVCPDETFAIFNDIRIDALDYSAHGLLDALIPPPMMTDKKIVTVSGLNIGGMRQSEISDLCEALGELQKYDYNLLIISVPAGQIDEGYIPKNPSAIIKRLSEFITPVYFEPISGARLTSWVGKHLQHNGVTASPAVCTEIVNYCGRSMYTLSAETEKLAYYVLHNGRSEVTSADVKNVCIAEISSDTFALANAIISGRGDEALKALEVLKFRRVEPVIVMGEVSSTVCDMIKVKVLMKEGMSPVAIAAAISTLGHKVSEYKVKRYMAGVKDVSEEKLYRALALCSEADLALKHSSSDYSDIERFICSI